MESIEEALKTAGVGDDLQTVLQVLETVGFKRQEAAAGPFASMDTTVLVGLNLRMLSAIESNSRSWVGPQCSVCPMLSAIFSNEGLPLNWRLSPVSIASQPSLWLELLHGFFASPNWAVRNLTKLLRTVNAASQLCLWPLTCSGTCKPETQLPGL